MPEIPDDSLPRLTGGCGSPPRPPAASASPGTEFRAQTSGKPALLSRERKRYKSHWNPSSRLCRSSDLAWRRCRCPAGFSCSRGTAWQWEGTAGSRRSRGWRGPRRPGETSCSGDWRRASTQDLSQLIDFHTNFHITMTTEACE